MSEGDTTINALIGAVITIIASGVPASPLIGGAVAGYLQGGERDDGIRVGLLTGLFTFLVGGILLLGGFAIFSAMAVGAGPGGDPFFLMIPLLLFFMVIALVYTVGLAALGGWLGNYVKYDTDILE